MIANGVGQGSSRCVRSTASLLYLKTIAGRETFQVLPSIFIPILTFSLDKINSVA